MIYNLPNTGNVYGILGWITPFNQARYPPPSFVRVVPYQRRAI